MLLKRRKLRHINSIAHEGKVLVFATDADGKIAYTVKQDGFEDTCTGEPGWEEWRELEFPNEGDDPSVVEKEKEEWTYQDKPETFILRSLYKTADQSAVAPVQLVSGLGHLYVFRQSKANTLLVDRFVLDGMTNRLVRKLEVRFKRSRQRYKPLEGTNANQATEFDSLDFRDADGKPFHEPTTELCTVNHLHQGWFSVVLLPTNEHDKHRWHIFAYHSDSGKVELTSIRASENGLFDVKDDTVLEPKPGEEDILLPRSIPGIIQRTLDLRDENGKEFQVANGLAATKYDLQVERETQAGSQLLREDVKVMLVIPTDGGDAAALSFAVAADGTLAQIDETPDEEKILRSNERHILLPLNTLDDIKAIGDTTPPPQGTITGMERGEEDRVRIICEQASNLKAGDIVEIGGTTHYNGHYMVDKVDGDTFEIEARWVEGEMGHWEVVPEEESGLVFEGMITAFEKTADGKLRVTCPYHGLQEGDEVQIVDTKDLNATYPVTRIDGDHFTLPIQWPPGEAVNLRQARQRRGITFSGKDEYIEIPPLDLKTPSEDRPFGETLSAWVWVPAVGSGQQLIVGQKDELLQLILDDGKATLKVNFAHGHGFEQVQDPTPVLEKKWVHYAGAFSWDKETGDTALTLCRNGVQVTSQVFEEGALACDGVDDYVKIPDSDSIDFDTNQDFTVEAWIKAASDQVDLTYTDNDIIEKWAGGSSYPYVIRYANGTGQVIAGRYDRESKKNPGVSSETKVNDNQFHHVAFVKNGSQLYLYIDGKLEDETTDTTQASTKNASPLYLACRGGKRNFFKGHIADVRIWDHARTPDEIQADMHRRLAGNEPGLAGYWRFEGGAARDYSEHQNHGTLHGDPQKAPSPPQLAGWAPEFWVGGRNASGDAGAFFKGQIADLQIWDQARTAQEIKDSMYLQLTGREVGLAGYWRLGAIAEGKERTVVDFAQGHDGVVHGEAFVGAVRLNRTLQRGEVQAIQYVNDELFAVSQRATYVETLEFKTDPPLDPNDVDGEKPFEFSYWGQKNRGSEERIAFSGRQASDFEALADGWYLASCRFTVPDEVTLVRSFGIAEVQGEWDTLEVRKHRMRLMSDTVTEARYSDGVSLAALADQHAGLEETLKQVAQKEQEEAALLVEKWELEEKLAGLEDRSGIQDEVDNLKYSIIPVLEKEEKQYKELYKTELDNPLNYLCEIQLLYNGLVLHGYWKQEDKVDIFPSDRSDPHRLWWFKRLGGESCQILLKANGLALHGYWKQGDVVDLYSAAELEPHRIWKVTKVHESARWEGKLHKDLYEISLWFDKGLVLRGYWEQGDKVDLCPSLPNNAHCLWKLVKTDVVTNDVIDKRHKAWNDKTAELSRARTTLADKQAIVDADKADKTAWESRLSKVQEDLKKIRGELATLNTDFINAVRTTQQTPQAMPQLHKDRRGLATRGARLGFVRPASRLAAVETCEGNVQLSYFDRQGRMRQTHYDATSDRRNAAFEQWIPDALRACLNFDKDNSVVTIAGQRYPAPRLDTIPIIGIPPPIPTIPLPPIPTIPLDEEWTIEAWFFYPLPYTQEWNSLTRGPGGYYHIVVKDGKKLGAGQYILALPPRPSPGQEDPIGPALEDRVEFYDSGYNMDQLSDGWHHLAAVRKIVQKTTDKGTTEVPTTIFYIDGEEVGRAKAGSYYGDDITHIGNSKLGNQPFGKLAEVRVWGMALSEEEIAVNSKTLLSGREPGLVAYYPMNEATGDEVRDHSGNGYTGTMEGAGWWACTAPIGKLVAEDDTLPIGGAALVSAEYTTIGIDPDEGGKSAMMRRFLASPAPGGVRLLSGKRIEALDRLWVGNAQFDPTLLGYIEGPPPVPSENLTVQESYNGAASVELAMSEDMAFSWTREQEAGLGAALSLFAGVDSETFQLAPTGQVTTIEATHVGFKGDLAFAYSWLNQSSVTACVSSNLTDRLELRGSPEPETKFRHLGKRFIPKNVGYALVVSGLADIYIVQLKRSGKMVCYWVEPCQDIPRDINTITFLMNPAHTMSGSLDGLTGSSATSNRFFRHVPQMRAQYGSLYPASYFRLREAYALKRQIEEQDRERESYFVNFNSHLVDEWSVGRQVSRVDNGKLSDEEKEAKKKEIETRITDREQQVHALESFAGWQKKMENLLIRAGKRNIVNTYVWDADGGLHAESEQFANTVEHTIGGSFSLEAALGVEADFAIMKASFSLTAQATVHLTQTMTKTEARGKGFELNVDLSGVEGVGVTDYNDYPILPGEKVDRYRFMSFYLEPQNEHFHHFFQQVVDPEWLASNDEEARALRQIDQSKPNKTWRVLHRVTYVERPALMGFGRDLRPLPTPEEDTSQAQQLLTRLEQLEQGNQELATKVDQILRLEEDTSQTQQLATRLGQLEQGNQKLATKVDQILELLNSAGKIGGGKPKKPEEETTQPGKKKKN